MASEVESLKKQIDQLVAEQLEISKLFKQQNDDLKNILVFVKKLQEENKQLKLTLGHNTTDLSQSFWHQQDLITKPSNMVEFSHHDIVDPDSDSDSDSDD